MHSLIQGGKGLHIACTVTSWNHIIDQFPNYNVTHPIVIDAIIWCTFQFPPFTLPELWTLLYNHTNNIVKHIATINRGIVNSSFVHINNTHYCKHIFVIKVQAVYIRIQVCRITISIIVNSYTVAKPIALSFQCILYKRLHIIHKLFVQYEQLIY